MVHNLLFASLPLLANGVLQTSIHVYTIYEKKIIQTHVKINVTHTLVLNLGSTQGTKKVDGASLCRSESAVKDLIGRASGVVKRLWEMGQIPGIPWECDTFSLGHYI